MRKTITAIISSYRRPENIPIMIDRLQNQTYKPDRIIVWNNVSTSDGEFIKRDDVEVINTNSNNWNMFGAFVAGYLTNTDYIVQLDDDHPPGKRFFEYCIKKQEEQPGIYVRRGVILCSKFKYRPNTRFGSIVGDGELKQTDMGGGVVFMPKDVINCILSERPPTYDSIMDIHIAYTTQKYSDYKIYVPMPKEEDMLPKYKNEELPLKDGDRAMWQQPNHFIIRDGAVKYYSRKGWKLLYESDIEGS